MKFEYFSFEKLKFILIFVEIFTYTNELYNVTTINSYRLTFYWEYDLTSKPITIKIQLTY